MRIKKFVLITVAMAALSTTAFAQWPATKVLTMDVAETIAQGAMAKCRADATIPGTINAQGGVPIKVGDQTIGAVAVSGAPGGNLDAACANAGIAKAADKLK